MKPIYALTCGLLVALAIVFLGWAERNSIAMQCDKTGHALINGVPYECKRMEVE